MFLFQYFCSTLYLSLCLSLVQFPCVIGRRPNHSVTQNLQERSRLVRLYWGLLACPLGWAARPRGGAVLPASGSPETGPAQGQWGGHTEVRRFVDLPAPFPQPAGSITGLHRPQPGTGLSSGQERGAIVGRLCIQTKPRSCENPHLRGACN